MDLKQFTQAIQQIADEKGVAKDKIIETIEMALAAAYKRDYGKKGQIVRAQMDPQTGKTEFRQIKIVVDETMIKSEEEVKSEEEERARKLAEETEDKPEAEEKEPSSAKASEGKSEEDLSAEATTEVGAEAEKIVRFNPEKHLMIEEARKSHPDAKAGDELEFPLETREEYGRIAAQTAKQVIIQRIREIEREAVYEEYKTKQGELVSGIIQRVEGRNVFIDIGRAVGVLPPEEQIPYERYRIGDRIKALVTLVEQNPKGPGVFLSRSHPRLLKKLFELEVPEIASAVVEIKAVAREPGSRSKVAVASNDPAIDPVGSLVGQKGVRVSTVINELGGEKIDVIEWSEEAAEFIGNALSPAKVLDVEISEKRKEARAIVPEEQLSLAIGKGGQNVRLAAKLTGWKIDVRSSRPKSAVEEETAEIPKEQAETVEGSQTSEVKKEELKEALEEAGIAEAKPDLAEAEIAKTKEAEKKEKPKKKRSSKKVKKEKEDGTT